MIAENERLRRENQRLTAKLRQAETIIEVQKKLSEILGIPLAAPTTTGGCHEGHRATRTEVGTAAACRSLGVPRATLYRHRQTKPPASAAPRPKPPRALSEQERRQVLDVLHSEPFADKAPAEVYAALLDQGEYLCSIRTMYRILDDQREVRERRDQLRHPTYHKPQLVATAPNQVWSWDITKLLGPAKWTYFHLYVILDIYSRYVVGWMLASRESEHLAERLIRETVLKQGIARDQLTIHAIAGRRCVPRPWPNSWPPWGSPNLTAGLTSPTTTRFRRASSRR